ncbi:MAG: ABC transporter substrate-binding protein [Bacteroidales bacterium]|nr:ABC transporter substrate-binding protein [Bacteroidales bacterium]MCF8456574.1 ABC transporter substrate-binding protein [Bacteroidales bacterium]
MKIKTFYFVFILLGFASCTFSNDNQKHKSIKSEYRLIENSYAKGFSIKDYSNFSLLEVFNPWQGASKVKFQYVLYKGKAIPNHQFPEATEIKVPVRKIVCMSTTHIGFIDKLNELKSIVGIANTDLINNHELNERIDQGKIADVGYEQNVNFELLIGLSPDLIMSYSIGSEITGLRNKLNELDIQMIINAEYLESHPLGKAEWIKFVAMFYDKKELADSIFGDIEKQYTELVSKTHTFSHKPTVFTGLPWKGTWYISGGKSYAAQLITDAGGDFLWSDNLSHEAIGLSIESVFDVARNADFWINTGAANSMHEIAGVDERLTYFVALQDQKLYNNNAVQSKSGGNDYWESGLINPQIILKDLINIFHPGNLPDSNLVYYQKLK